MLTMLIGCSGGGPLHYTPPTTFPTNDAATDSVTTDTGDARAIGHMDYGCSWFWGTPGDVSSTNTIYGLGSDNPYVLVQAEIFCPTCVEPNEQHTIPELAGLDDRWEVSLFFDLDDPVYEPGLQTTFHCDLTTYDPAWFLRTVVITATGPGGTDCWAHGPEQDVYAAAEGCIVSDPAYR